MRSLLAGLFLLLAQSFTTGASSSSSSVADIYIYNSTDTSGFGYKVSADRFSFNSTTGKIRGEQSLGNGFSEKYIAQSGAAVCGDLYITILSDAPFAAGISVTNTSSSFSGSPTTVPTGGEGARTSYLFHQVSCDPSNTDKVYAFVNNPWGAPGTDFQIIHYNWKSQSTEKVMATFTLKTNEALQDSIFSFDSSCQRAFWLGQSTTIGGTNSGTLNVIDLATGATESGSINNVMPYQMFPPNSGMNTSFGIGQEVSGDKVTGLYFGSFSWGSSGARFEKISQIGSLEVTYMQGLPYSYCDNYVISLRYSGVGTKGDSVLLSAIDGKSGTIVDSFKVTRGEGEQRVIGGLAVRC